MIQSILFAQAIPSQPILSQLGGIEYTLITFILVTIFGIVIFSQRAKTIVVSGINVDNNSSSVVLSGRYAGIVDYVMHKINISPSIFIECNPYTVSYSLKSLSITSRHIISRQCIANVKSGISRPIEMLIAVIPLLAGFIVNISNNYNILAVIVVLMILIIVFLYYKSKKFYLTITASSGIGFRLEFLANIMGDMNYGEREISHAIDSISYLAMHGALGSRIAEFMNVNHPRQNDPVADVQDVSDRESTDRISSDSIASILRSNASHSSDVDAENADVLLNKAKMLIKQNSGDAAISVLEVLIHLFPKSKQTAIAKQYIEKKQSQAKQVHGGETPQKS